MGLLDAVSSRLPSLSSLSPGGWKALGTKRLESLVLGEIGRSRKRISEVTRTYPGASPRELAQHVMNHKKQLASMVGGVSGMFGLASIPADLLAMAWIQLQLLVDIATLYKVNLKSERARAELIELLGYANGVGPLQRAGPRVLGRVSTMLVKRGRWMTLGRTLPLLSAPLTAYLNNQHVQKVGEEALRFYDGMGKARDKRRSQHTPGSPP